MGDNVVVRHARIAFVGDVMLGRLVSREIRRRSPESFWTDVRPLLLECDAVIANLECAITQCAQQWMRTPKVYHFGAAPSAIDVLKAGNIKAVCLANNHVLDFEFAGLTETLQLLDGAAIAHAGSGTNETAARAPALFDTGNLKVALFGCVDHEQPFAATGERMGTAYVDIEAGEASAFPDAAEIGKARGDGADLVVLSCHLGPNMVLRPSRPILDYRHVAAARGVDIVHGHSAHLFQGVEMLRRSLILHDAGDFLNDYAVDPELRNDWSYVFVVDADASGVRQLTLYPVMLEFARVRLATAREAAAMFDRMIKLSAELGSDLIRDGERLVLGSPLGSS